MSKLIKLILLGLAIIFLFAQVSAALEAPVELELVDRKPSFTESERTLIHEYFKHILASIAPGSLDRADLPLAVEKALVAGGHVPPQYEKKLEPIPERLKKQLSLIPGDYAYYKLGKHVLIVHKATLNIADAVRNAGWLDNPAK